MWSLLQENGFPAGDRALAVSTVGKTHMSPVEGTNALANFSAVEVTGCLTRTSEAAWRLTSATNPVAASESTLSASGKPGKPDSGHRAFSLLGVYKKLDEHERHEMTVRGVLMKGMSTVIESVSVRS